MAALHPLRRSFVLGVVAALAVGCGGDGGGGVPIIDVSAQGRVALGALGNATLQVYRVGDYGAPVVTTTTSSGATLGEIGNFAFTLEGVPANAMFLLVATGGVANDKDENGVLDGPTANLGAVHALASAAQLNSHAVLVSAVTEVVYQRVRYFLQAVYGDAFLLDACNSWTSFVLRSDLTGDAVIDSDDALAFDPLVHAGATFRAYSPGFTSFVSDLLAALPQLTPEAFALSREEIHFTDVAGGTAGVDLVGNYAYVCHGTSGLKVWDVSNPESPSVTGAYDTPGTAVSVQVVGTLAYVADMSKGLQILDVSNPAVPTLAGSVPTSGPVNDVHVVGNRVYLSDGDFTTPMLFVVDVTTPATASILGSLPLAAPPNAVRVEGDFAYLTEPLQIETVDVSNPSDPVSEGTVTAESYSHLDVTPGYLFVGSPSRLEVFSLSNPSAPESIASVPMPGNYAESICVRGTRAFVARSFDSLCVVDVEDPSAPFVLGLIPTSGGAEHVDVEGDLCVVTEVNGGLSTVAPGTPVPSGVVAKVALAAGVDAVEAVGNRVYAATTSPTNLVVLDATNPLHPSATGSVGLATSAARDIVVKGTLAFVAESGGLEVYDVANASAPAFLDGDDTLGSLQRLAVDTNVAYAAAMTALAVYDVSTPGATTFLTSLPALSTARGVARDGSAVLLASGFVGVATFDATVPTAPTPAGTVACSEAIDVVLQPPFAYVTQFSGSGIDDRLTVVDYSVLNAPTSPSHVSLPGEVDRVVRAGSLLYVSGYNQGVNVVDVSVPNAPVHVGSIPVPASIEDLAVAGAYVYVAGGYGDGALHVLRAAQVTVP